MEEVQDLLRANCASGQFASYAEAPGPSVTTFTAACQGEPLFNDASVTFERMAEQEVLVEKLVSDETGSLFFIPSTVVSPSTRQ